MQSTKKGKHRNVLDGSKDDHFIVAVANMILVLVLWALYTVEDLWKEKGMMLLLAIVVFFSLEGAIGFSSAWMETVDSTTAIFPGTAWLITAVTPVMMWIVPAMAILAVVLFLLTGVLQFIGSSIHGLQMTIKNQHLLLTTN